MQAHTLKHPKQPTAVHRHSNISSDTILIDSEHPCVQEGILEKHGVELIGAKLPSINKAEDRELFKQAMAEIGLKTPASGWASIPFLALREIWLSCTWIQAVQIVNQHRKARIIWRFHQHCTSQQHVSAGTAAISDVTSMHNILFLYRTATTMEEALAIHQQIGKFPLIIRPAFTLGGSGGGIAYNMEEFQDIVQGGLTASVTSQARCPDALEKVERMKILQLGHCGWHW